MKKRIVSIIIVFFIGMVLYIFSSFNYPFFHLTVEFFTMLVGVLIFSVSIVSKNFNQTSFLITLGPGIFVASLITFLHAVTYKGMGIIPGYDANLPTQLWIVLNYILAVAILIAINFEHKKINYNLMLTLFSLIGLVATLLCFIRVFPDCFVDGTGLTLFKKISEYVIILIYLYSLFLLYKGRQKYSSKFFNAMVTALALFAAAEFMFTLYSDVYGIQNFLGHFFRLVAFFVIYISIALESITSIFSKLNDLSVTDGLTNLYNHRFFLEALEKCKELSLDKNKYFYLIVFDIDKFKNINDTYGHLIGDEVLKETGQIIKSNIRNSDSDFAFRIGGDEFAIILYDAPIEIVNLIIYRIRETFAVSQLTDENIRITLCGGVARYSDGSIQNLIVNADQLLYNAKHDGRDRIYFDSDRSDL